MPRKSTLDPDAQERLVHVLECVHRYRNRIPYEVDKAVADVWDRARQIYLHNELTRRARRSCPPPHVLEAIVAGDKSALCAMGRKGGRVAAARRSKKNLKKPTVQTQLFLSDEEELARLEIDLECWLRDEEAHLHTHPID